jgi:hypothetical protein
MPRKAPRGGSDAGDVSEATSRQGAASKIRGDHTAEKTGDRLQGNSSLRRVDVGADALNEAVGFDPLSVEGRAARTRCSTRFPVNVGGRLLLPRLKAVLSESGAASEALDVR